NLSSSAAGGVFVELQDASGKPIPGFTLDDCIELNTDDLDRVVAWKNGSDVGTLAGKSIRIRFRIKDADLFSFQFTE
ncbi:MAG: hypothetical protein RI963_3735, partial [Planctomycetota bacterium]